jgi:hypothetical protein
MLINAATSGDRNMIKKEALDDSKIQRPYKIKYTAGEM